MQLVLIVHGELIASVLRVVAGVFAAGLAEAGSRGTQVGAGAAEVGFHFMRDLPENFFQLGGLGAQKHDVAGGAVQVGQAGAAQIPDVAQMAQILGAVVLAGRLVHAHGMEVGHAGELFGWSQ